MLRWWRRWKEAGIDCLEVVKGSVKSDVKQSSESTVEVCLARRLCTFVKWHRVLNSCCLKILDQHQSSGLQYLQVQAEWILRPSEDKALRTADIGASGVSEVLTDSRRCHSQASALNIHPDQCSIVLA